MKCFKAIAVLFCAVGLFSCDNPYSGIETVNSFAGRNLDFTFDMPRNVHGFIDAMWWVRTNIKYKYDREAHEGKADYWQTPRETIALGTGDCEDFCILLIAMFEKLGMVSSRMLIIETDVAGVSHAIVDLGNGYFCEPQTMTFVEEARIIYKLNWDQIKTLMNFPGSPNRSIEEQNEF